MRVKRCGVDRSRFQIATVALCFERNRVFHFECWLSWKFGERMDIPLLCFNAWLRPTFDGQPGTALVGIVATDPLSRFHRFVSRFLTGNLAIRAMTTVRKGNQCKSIPRYSIVGAFRNRCCRLRQHLFFSGADSPEPCVTRASLGCFLPFGAR